MKKIKILITTTLLVTLIISLSCNEKKEESLYPFNNALYKWGYMNEIGEVVIEPQFDEAKPFLENNLAIVKLNKKVGVINKLGNFVIEAKYDSINIVYDESSWLYAVEKNKKWGFVKENGKQIVQCNFDNFGLRHLLVFGFIDIQLDGKWGVMNMQGEIIVEPLFYSIYAIGTGQDIIGAFTKNRKLEGTISKKGEVKYLPEYEYDDDICGGEFNRIIDYLDNEEKIGFINFKNGKVITPRFDDANEDFDIDPCKRIKEKFELIAVKQNGTWGFMDENGDIAFQTEFDFCWNFHEGLAVVVKDGKWGAINKEGEIVIQIKYDRLRRAFDNELNGSKSILINKKGEVAAKGMSRVEFKNDFATIRQEGRYGLINRKGQILVKPIYDDINIDFKNSVAIVKQDGKWGLINKKGEVVIHPQFNKIISSGFRKGFVKVKQDGKWGIINKKGQILVKPIYDDINIVVRIKDNKANGKCLQKHVTDLKYFTEFIVNCIYGDKYHKRFSQEIDLIVVEKKYKKGIIDKLGKIIVQPMYDDIAFYCSNLIGVKLKSKWGLVDKNGKILVPPQFNNIFDIGGRLMQVKIGRKRWGLINDKGKFVSFTEEDIFREKRKQ